MDDVREPWMIDPRYQEAVDAILNEPWPDEPEPVPCEIREVGAWELGRSVPGRLVVDIREAARILGCGRSLLYKLIKAGQLPFVKVGHLTKIPSAALEEFVARGLAEPRPGGRPWWEELDR